MESNRALINTSGMLNKATNDNPYLKVEDANTLAGRLYNNGYRFKIFANTYIVTVRDKEEAAKLRYQFRNEPDKARILIRVVSSFN